MCFFVSILQGLTANLLYGCLVRMFQSSKRLLQWIKNKRKEPQILSDMHVEGNLLMHQAESERKSGKYTIALQLYKQAEKIYEATCDRMNQADVLLKMGLLENILKNNCNEARYYLGKARAVAPIQGSQHIELKTGALYSRWGKYELAAFYYEKAEALCKRKRDKPTLANLYRLWGIMEGMPAQNNLDKAREYLAKSSDLYERLGDAEGQAKVRQALGDMERENGNLSAAIENYNIAYCLFADNGHFEGMITIMAELCRACALSGNKKEALEWKNQIDAQHDRIQEKEKHYINSIISGLF